MVKTKKIGQITIKRVGKQYAVCISGDPQEIFTTLKMAECKIGKLRDKHGRRNYKYKKKIR